ncbi:MAG: hypothetical protein IJN65_04540 [Clostridia bacterium]|nr:hypothetical protein [Clostridia bacterium]
MRKEKYKLICSLSEDEQGRSIKTYGIVVNDKTEIPDISCNKQTVLELIERLGDEDLSMQQLFYIIEDSII